MAARLKRMGTPKYRNNFRYTEHEAAVEAPLRWRKPRRIFVNSMSDLFHEAADMSFVSRCFEAMCRGAPQHTYQVLTKRPRRMAEFAAHFERYAGCQIPAHVWMGTSVENADVAGRIDELRQVRCAVRFASFEPLLGALPEDVDLSGISWVIIGGESGAGYRPMQADQVRGLIACCRRQAIPTFFKQWGGPRPAAGRLTAGRMMSIRMCETRNLYHKYVTPPPHCNPPSPHLLVHFAGSRPKSSITQTNGTISVPEFTMSLST